MAQVVTCCAGSLEGAGRRLGGLPQGFRSVGHLYTIRRGTPEIQEPLMHLKTWGWPWVSHWHEQKDLRSQRSDATFLSHKGDGRTS